MTFKHKYLKYKQKYLSLKNQLGGVITCKEAFKNVLGTCWAISEQMILTSGQATSNDLEVVMTSFTKETKNNFITKRIQQVKSDPILSKFFPDYIFGHLKIDYLRNILDKFIDRYYSKFFKLRNPQRPEETDNFDSNLSNKGRCELVISNNFKKLFDYDILKKNNSELHGGFIYHQYLFINLLSIFFLGYKLSFINYYNNFNEINFNDQTNVGILVITINHACCLFNCYGSEKYYNDNDQQIYDCEWKKLLKSTSINNLYIERGYCLRQIDIESYEGNKQNLSKVLYLTVVKKHTQDNVLDIEIKNFLNLTNLDTITDNKLLYLLGIYYYEQIKNYEEAFKYLKKATDQGYILAQYMVGYMYYNSQYVSQSYKESFKYFKLAADQGYILTQYHIGHMFYYGHGADQDYKNAYKYLKLVVDQHNIEKEKYIDAQYHVGLMYYYGQGIDKNLLAALLLFRSVSTEGHIEANYYLGIMYYHGQEVSRSYKNAFTHFKLAADKNHTEAQYMVGFMNYNGQGILQSYTEAFKYFMGFKYFKLAAYKDYTEAQYMVGFMYYNGQGISQSYEDALSYFKLAANKDHTESQYMVGFMYYNGQGISQSHIDAFHYFKLAADKGHTKAQYMVGFMYYNGQGVEQNYEEVEKYYKLAADNKHYDALVKLANFYLLNKKNKELYKYYALESLKIINERN